MDDNDNTVPPRRQFLLDLVGKGTSVSIALAGKTLEEKISVPGASTTDADSLVSRLGIARLQHGAKIAVDEFSSSALGGLSYWYQNFWLLNREIRDVKALDELSRHEWVKAKAYNEAASKGSELPKPMFADKEHRARVLPGIARIHALVSSEPSVANLFRADIEALHFSALDEGQEPHREVLEIIWQVATAALVRNEINWRSFDIGTPMVRQAVLVCQYFLRNDVVLFHPAVAAWQFLLTYRMAAIERGAGSLAMIEKAIATVLTTEHASSSYWFTELKNLYAGRKGFAQRIPQFNECVIAQSLSNVVDRQIADYFIRVRFMNSFIGVLVARGDLQTKYIGRDRQAKLANTSITLVTNFGFTKSDWPRIANIQATTDARQGLTGDAVQHWEQLFSEFDPLKHGNKWELRDTAAAEGYLRLLPFSSLDSQHAALQALAGKQSIADIVRKGSRSGSVESKLNALWSLTFSWMNTRLFQLYGVPRQKMETPLDVSDLSEDMIRSDLQYLRDHGDELLGPRHREQIGVSGSSKSAGLAENAEYGSLKERSNQEPQAQLGAPQNWTPSKIEKAPQSEETTVENVPNDQFVDREMAHLRAESDFSTTVGRAVYEEIRSKLESEFSGKFIAVNSATREYVVRPSRSEASDAYQQLFGNVPGWCRQIGSR